MRRSKKPWMKKMSQLLEPSMIESVTGKKKVSFANGVKAKTLNAPISFKTRGKYSMYNQQTVL